MMAQLILRRPCRMSAVVSMFVTAQIPPGHSIGSSWCWYSNDVEAEDGQEQRGFLWRIDPSSDVPDLAAAGSIALEVKPHSLCFVAVNFQRISVDIREGSRECAMLCMPPLAMRCSCRPWKRRSYLHEHRSARDPEGQVHMHLRPDDNVVPLVPPHPLTGFSSLCKGR